LHSTCEDVKRILNITNCEEPSFQLEDAIVSINFSHKPCADGWNVPSGTVISITIRPKKKLALSELRIDMEKYEKVRLPHQRDWTVYLNAEEGVSLTVAHDGMVQKFTYGPTAKDAHLSYPNSLAELPKVSSIEDDSIKLEEYGSTSFNKEKIVLDKFAASLKGRPAARAFIIAYGGRHSRNNEAINRAERAKNYLINVKGVDVARVIAVDGGYREEHTVELFISPNGIAVPTPLPTVCPSEIIIR